MLPPRVIEIRDQARARAEIARIGSDEVGLGLMTPKFVYRVLKLEAVPLRAAIILKQEMLARGGEAAVSREVAGLKAEVTDVLLGATLRQYREVVARLKAQPFGLAGIGRAITEALGFYDAPGASNRAKAASVLACGHGRWQFPLGERTYIVGILNVTPDSFSDGGSHFTLDQAAAAARAMVADGADIIDIGGESTRPGGAPVPAGEELERIIPVIRALRRELDAPISVDTYKAEVAEQAIKAGAQIINDISGLRADPRMAGVAARHEAPVIIMHRKGDPEVMQVDPAFPCEYEDLVAEILAYLQESVGIAEAAGVPRERLIIDPGIGFGKTLEQNLEILRRLGEFRALGLPILLGTSRKSFIGKILDLPPGERVEGTAASVAVGIANGADFVRVHDVREMARVCRVTDAIVRRGE